MKTDHRLIVVSTHDAQAKCSCGKWQVSCVGARTMEYLRTEHKLHTKWLQEETE